MAIEEFEDLKLSQKVLTVFIWIFIVGVIGLLIYIAITSIINANKQPDEQQPTSEGYKNVRKFF
jgi:hypothetical protein